MTTYKIRTEAGLMYVSADMAQASAPIRVYFGDDPLYYARGESCDCDGGRWSPTPFQTADCRHREDRMASMIANHYDMGDVISVDAL